MRTRLAALVALSLLVPFGVRALDGRYGDHRTPASYLPALEGPRARAPFDPFPLNRMIHLRPELVVIGDSMAGTRIDTALLAQVSGRRVFGILHPGSGPAYWYLALKNYVIASGVRPRYVFIFFRDTNLTDVLFRMDGWNVDAVARDEERELNDVIASRVGEWRLQLTARTEAAYAADRARVWMTPLIGRAASRAAVPGGDPSSLVAAMNERFDFQHLRPVEAADIDPLADTNADFDRYIDRSLLPLMLRDARHAGITLYFVRVQRRPVGRRPPFQSAALRDYTERLADYIRRNGGLWHDDTGDPALSIDLYGDGDHLARDARARYTSIFWNRVGPNIN